jgi:ribulose-5-phosphate 4-epimerase/fuculose-1-phosphate aldolase
MKVGTSTPVYDIAAYYQPDDIQDILVRNVHLGKALADHFTDSKEKTSKTDHAVVLMRGHGMTVVAPNIEECVLRSIYTPKNASIQSTVLLTRAAYQVSGNTPAGPAAFLNKQEAAAAAEMTHWSSSRPWGLWVSEVEKSALYSNTIA